MVQKITDQFNQFQSHFSYRKKFVFLALLFLISVPIPTYWNFQYLYHASKLNTLHNYGLEVQNTLTALLCKTSQYAILDINDRNDPTANPNQKTLLSLQKDIDELINDIHLWNQNVSEVPLANLSAKEEAERNIQLLIGFIDHQWKEISIGSLKDKVQASIYLELLQQMAHLLYQLRDHFDLTLGMDEPLNEITEALLLIYPKMTLQITEASLKKIEEKKKNTVALSIYSYLLKKEFFILHRNLSSSFQHFVHDSWRPEHQLYHQNINALDQFKNSLNNLIASFSFSLPSDSYADLASSTIRDLEKSAESNHDFARFLVKRHLEFITSLRLFLLFVLLFGSFNVIIFVLFRILSGHLVKLMNYIENISQGNLETTISMNAKDIVGQIGLAFSKMGSTIKQIVNRLKDVGIQLKEFSQKIVLMSDEQEKAIASQESKLQSLGVIAKEIAIKSRELANVMNILITTSQNVVQGNSSMAGIENMKEALTSLVRTSTVIFEKINGIYEKICKANHLIEYMGRVSEQAHLLSLNASIETLNIDKQRGEFFEITKQIERFAETTAISTQEMQKIIGDMFSRLSLGQKIAKQCVNEIHAGVNRLLLVSNQLVSMAREGQKQTLKFISVNNVMQEQAKEAETIIETIDKLSSAAHENTNSIKHLRQTIEELSATTHELHDVLNHFFTKKQYISRKLGHR